MTFSPSNTTDLKVHIYMQLRDLILRTGLDIFQLQVVGEHEKIFHDQRGTRTPQPRHLTVPRAIIAPIGHLLPELVDGNVLQVTPHGKTIPGGGQTAKTINSSHAPVYRI